MKRVIKIFMFVIFFFGIISLCSIANAASASIGASKSNIYVGESVNITVSINAATWNLKVSGPVEKSIADTTDDGENGKKTESIKFSPSKAGTYEFSLSGDVSDGSTMQTENIKQKTTITVSEMPKATPNANDSEGKTNNDKVPTQEKEPTFKNANDTVYATGSINVRKSYSADSDKLGALNAGDSVTRTGIGDNGWSKVTYNGATGYIKTSLLSTEAPKKSEDKALKSLEIVGCEIEPVFDPEITDYSVVVSAEVEQLEIRAIANSDKAKVDLPENQKLEIGENILKITVTAEDQTARTYTVTVTKQPEENITLSSLKVEGYTLSPKFSPDVLEYKLTILDPKVNSLNINALSGVENAKIEITGNNNLKDGENIALVKVTSEDGSKTNTYKIIVNKQAEAVASNDSNNFILYGGIGVIAFLVILIIVVIVIAKRKAREDDEHDIYRCSEYYRNDNDSSDLYENSNNTEPDKKDAEFEGSKIEDNENSNIDSYSNKTYFEKDADSYKADSSSGYAGSKDVNYYNNKVSEIFDNVDNNLNVNKESNLEAWTDGFKDTDKSENYSSNDNSWGEDDYKPRRSKGKHSK